MAERMRDQHLSLFDSIKGRFAKLDIGVSSVYVSSAVDGRCTIDFEVHGGDLTFDQLQKVSHEFDTKLINVSHGSTTGGCESCGWGADSWISVTVLKAKA